MISTSILQKHFGRFRYKDNLDGTIAIDRQWLSDSIVPIKLFEQDLYCHRNIYWQIKNAFNEIKEAGISIDDKIIIFQAKHIDNNLLKPLSRHCWGIAISINWHTPLHKVTEILNKWGFNWKINTDNLGYFELSRIVYYLK